MSSQVIWSNANSKQKTLKLNSLKLKSYSPSRAEWESSNVWNHWFSVWVVEHAAPSILECLLDFAERVSISWWQELVGNPCQIFMTFQFLFRTLLSITWSLQAPCWYPGCCPSTTWSLVQRPDSDRACAPPSNEVFPGLHQQAAAIWAVIWSGFKVLRSGFVLGVRSRISWKWLVLGNSWCLWYPGIGWCLWYPAWLSLGCCSNLRSPPSVQSSSTEGTN